MIFHLAMISCLILSWCFTLSEEGETCRGMHLIFEPTAPGFWVASCTPQQVKESARQLEEFVRAKVDEEIAQVDALGFLSPHQVAKVKQAALSDRTYVVAMFRKRTRETTGGESPTMRWDAFNPILRRPILNGNNLASKVAVKFLDMEQRRDVALFYAERIRTLVIDASVPEQQIEDLIKRLALSVSNENPFRLNCRIDELVALALKVDDLNVELGDALLAIKKKVDKEQRRSSNWVLDLRGEAISDSILREKGIFVGGK